MNTVSPESVGLSSERLSRIRPAIQGFIDRKKLAGVITLVARQGKIAHMECVGQMDMEAGKPMQPDAIFRIYSMTKPITSVALMMLVEQGRLLLSGSLIQICSCIQGVEGLRRSRRFRNCPDRP